MSRALILLLTGCAVIAGAVRSLVDSHFTTRRAALKPLVTQPPWRTLAPRLALISMDGLRPTEAFDPARMPLLAARRRAGAWGRATSSAMTMTVSGVRMLGTGTSTDFLEVLHNWDPRPADVPSIFTAARAAGRRTVLFSRGSWGALYEADFDVIVQAQLDFVTYHSDLTRIPDQAHMKHVHQHLQARQPFDLLVVHLTGPDHASHQYTVRSERFRTYLRWLDPRLDRLIQALLEADAVVVLTSDHGMTDKGQHGGDEPIARQIPYLFLGPGIRAGPGPPLDQADIPATVAALLGLRIPPAGEGRVAWELLDAPSAVRRAISRSNVAQASRYLQAHQARFGDVPPALLDPPASPAAARAYLSRVQGFRRDSRGSVQRTWIWMGCLLALGLTLIVQRPGYTARPVRLALAAIPLGALALAAASWSGQRLLWPAALAAVAAVAAAAAVALPRKVNSTWTRRAALSAVWLGLLGALLGLGYLGFARQFRGETFLGWFPPVYYRGLGYLLALFITAGVVVAGRKRGAVSPASPWLALILLVLTLPTGKLLLYMAPGLALGCLWLSWLRGGVAAGLVQILERGWPLFLTSLAWVAMDATAGTPGVGTLAATLRGCGRVLASHVPLAAGVVGVGLLALQLRRWRGADDSPWRRVASFGATAAALPALLLVELREQHLVALMVAAGAALLLALLVRDRRHGRWQQGLATLGACCLLCNPGEELTLLVLAGSVWVFVLWPSPAAMNARDDPQTRMAGAAWLAAALLFTVIALQLLRDGSFSFSDYDMSVAFLGNPTHASARAALQIVLRFALPILLLLIPAVRAVPGGSWALLLIGLVLVRLAWLFLGFLAAGGQFYTPYRLAGEAVFFIGLLLLVPLLTALVLAGRPRVSSG